MSDVNLRRELEMIETHIAALSRHEPSIVDTGLLIQAEVIRVLLDLKERVESLEGLPR